MGGTCADSTTYCNGIEMETWKLIVVIFMLIELLHFSLQVHSHAEINLAIQSSVKILKNAFYLLIKVIFF